MYRLASPITLWVSSVTNLPVQIETAQLAIDNYRAVIPRVVHLSDYRLVNGIVVPFKQEEMVNGVVISTLQFTNVQMNVGFSDADFAVAIAQGGK